MYTQLIVLLCLGLLAVSEGFTFNNADLATCGGFCTDEYYPVCAYDFHFGLYIFDNYCFMDLANECRQTSFYPVDPGHCIQ